MGSGPARQLDGFSDFLARSDLDFEHRIFLALHGPNDAPVWQVLVPIMCMHAYNFLVKQHVHIYNLVTGAILV
jgi:hypothetical protein